mmetsp:Transcript_35782/g.107587  ORF Transcript_35782/g.107587 Transcript_35782/m.107587 type:complete len:163 (-) Transcript_35782:444-932(-)
MRLVSVAMRWGSSAEASTSRPRSSGRMAMRGAAAAAAAAATTDSAASAGTVTAHRAGQHRQRGGIAAVAEPLPWWLQQWSALPLGVKVAVWLVAALAADRMGELRAFFVLAGLVAVYAHTRESTRRPGDKSAYSVFNKNCDKIDGTFDYNDFEKSLRSGGVV